jgi:glycopeptide antibiotics resistance protein
LTNNDCNQENFAELSSLVLGYRLNLGFEFDKYFCEMRYERSITPVFYGKDIDDVFYTTLNSW